MTCPVKEQKHETTLAKHSEMKTKADEAKAFRKWKQKRDDEAKRTKTQAPARRCAECDRLYNH